MSLALFFSDMVKKYILIIVFVLFCLFTPTITFAHPGNVSYDGCHYCKTRCDYWGFTYGTRHNNFNYSNTCDCDPSLGPRDPIYCSNNISNITGKWTFIPDSTTQTYDVYINWEDPSPSSYSLTISKYVGDPGPRPDTNEQWYLFENIAPGTWYVNIKKSVNGYWSNYQYWTVTVPVWGTLDDRIVPINPTTVSDSVVESDSTFNWSTWIIGGVVIYFGILIFNYFKKTK